MVTYYYIKSILLVLAASDNPPSEMPPAAEIAQDEENQLEIVSVFYLDQVPELERAINQLSSSSTSAPPPSCKSVYALQSLQVRYRNAVDCICNTLYSHYMGFPQRLIASQYLWL